jgi:hypothetical protein
MKKLMKKLTSRKFIVSVAGIISGIVTISVGNSAEGITVVIASVIAYLITEGYIDAKALDIADTVIEETKDKLEGNTND